MTVAALAFATSMKLLVYAAGKNLVLRTTAAELVDTSVVLLAV